MHKAFDRRPALYSSLALSLLLIVFCSASVQAQTVDAAPPPQSGPIHTPNGQNERARDPLRALNLTADQLQQIRAIREQSRDDWRAARQRMAEAHRALDEAIYSDNVNEGLIEERVRELGAAQAAVSRMRALTELSIRRVLTLEQLNTLRVMRQQARANGGARGRSGGPNERPLRRRNRLGRRGGGTLEDEPLNNPGTETRPLRGESLRGRIP